MKKPLCYLMYDRGTTRYAGSSNSPAGRVEHFDEVIGGITWPYDPALVLSRGQSSPFDPELTQRTNAPP